MALAALVFAGPFPAYWRMKWELRGYAMSMAVNAWRHGGVLNGSVDGFLGIFTGADYYFMWPFRKGMKARLEDALNEIHNGGVLMWGAPYQHVKAIGDIPDDYAIKAARKVQCDEQEAG
jgi:hypothetical protein